MSEVNLADRLYYCPGSPTGLRWKDEIRRGRNYNVVIPAGSVAGTKRTDGTAWQVRLADKSWLAHVVVWMLCNGAVPSGFVIDHEDGNGLNNKLANLRAVTQGVNCRNQKKRKTNLSGTTGVSKHTSGNYWVASWTDAEGKRVSRYFSVAKFSNAEALAEACREEAIEKLNTAGAGYSVRHGK